MEIEIKCKHATIDVDDSISCKTGNLIIDFPEDEEESKFRVHVKSNMTVIITETGILISH